MARCSAPVKVSSQKHDLNANKCRRQKTQKPGTSYNLNKTRGNALSSSQQNARRNSRARSTAEVLQPREGVPKSLVDSRLGHADELGHSAHRLRWVLLESLHDAMHAPALPVARECLAALVVAQLAEGTHQVGTVLLREAPHGIL